MKKKILIYLAIVCIPFLLLSGCFFGPAVGCDVDADCPTDTFCVQRSCVIAQDISCQFDDDCPPTTACDTFEERCFLL